MIMHIGYLSAGLEHIMIEYTLRIDILLDARGLAWGVEYTHVEDSGAGMIWQGYWTIH